MLQIPELVLPNPETMESVHFQNPMIQSQIIDELYLSSSPSSFQTEAEECPISSISLEDGIFSTRDMQRLLEIESELTNGDAVNQESEEVFETNQEVVDVCHQENVYSVRTEFCLTELLLAAAEALEAQNHLLASIIIQKLRQLSTTEENGDGLFGRLAQYFIQGLHCKNSNDDTPDGTLCEPAVLQQGNTMSAFQMIQELSPFVKFAHFTANQAILEATQGEKEVHVIDFDIMEGIQWPPLMVDLAARQDASLKITAVFGDKASARAVRETGRRLTEFADSIKLKFVFHHLELIKEEDLHRIDLSTAVIANCVIDQFYMPRRIPSLVKTFLSGVSKLSPRMIILVEEELSRFSKMPPMSFVDFFSEAIHHYTAISESLQDGFSGGYRPGIKMIEKDLLGAKILDGLRQYPCGDNEGDLWEDGSFLLKGFIPIQMSFYNVSQAKFLVSLFNGGFWVQLEQGRLALCWKSRPLTTVSTWVPN